MCFCLQPLEFLTYVFTLGKLAIDDLKSLVTSQLRQQIKTNTLSTFDKFLGLADDQVISLINQYCGAKHAILATQSLFNIEIKSGDALLRQILITATLSKVRLF